MVIYFLGLHEETLQECSDFCWEIQQVQYYLWGMWREPVAGCRTVVTPPLIKFYCKLMLVSKHGDLSQSQYVTVKLMMTMPENTLPASQIFFGTPLEFDQMATGKTPKKLDTHSDTHSSGISSLEISNHSPQPAEPEPSSDLHPYHCGGHTNEHPAPSGPRLVSTTDGRPQGQHGWNDRAIIVLDLNGGESSPRHANPWPKPQNAKSTDTVS